LFLDLRQISNNATGYTPYTPNLPILYGLRKSLDMLFAEGLDNVYARHFRLVKVCVVLLPLGFNHLRSRRFSFKHRDSRCAQQTKMRVM
jgi:aspartate aminotransferase-like enzyme